VFYSYPNWTTWLTDPKFAAHDRGPYYQLGESMIEEEAMRETNMKKAISSPSCSWL